MFGLKEGKFKANLWKFRSLTKTWTIAYTSDKIYLSISQILVEKLACWTLCWMLKLEWIGYCMRGECCRLVTASWSIVLRMRRSCAVCGLSWNHCSYWWGRRFVCLFHPMQRGGVEAFCWQAAEAERDGMLVVMMQYSCKAVMPCAFIWWYLQVEGTYSNGVCLM